MKGKKIRYMEVEEFYTKMVMFGFTIDVDRFEEIANITFENRPVEKKIPKAGAFQSNRALNQFAEVVQRKKSFLLQKQNSLVESSPAERGLSSQ